MPITGPEGLFMTRERLEIIMGAACLFFFAVAVFLSACPQYQDCLAKLAHWYEHPGYELR
jgi:hypothetical protein